MPPTAMAETASQLLDSFPGFRSQSADEARTRIGQVFSPHRLAVRHARQPLAVRHNQVRFEQLGIHVLSYGAEVSIDPGERGDFYLLQLPLQGQALMQCGTQEARLSPEVMGVLRPRERTRMRWSADCAMLLLQVSRPVLHSRLAGASALREPAGVRLTLPRADPRVAAWWQSVLDLTRNLHHHGPQWQRQPATWQAMETFLLAGLQLLASPDEAAAPALPGAGRHRCLDRALDFIQAHAHEGLTLARIAEAACVSPRTLETAFRRTYDQSPLSYARGVQLEMVHAQLRAAAQAGQALRVTDVALQHGFAHMGRFAAYYRQRFGCTPTQTLQGAR